MIGHEIGHVTARHTVQRMSQQELIALGLGLGTVISDKTRALVPLASAGLEVLFLKFSRNDEYQADQLGVRYASRADYDVRQMPDMFRMLERVSQQGSGGRLPEWLSTHPEPEHRIERIEDNDRPRPARAGAAACRPRRVPEAARGPGLRRGSARGLRARRPLLSPAALRFSIDVPESWKTQNTRAALIMASPQQDALIQLSAGPAEEPEQALLALASQKACSSGGAAGRRSRSAHRVGRARGVDAGPGRARRPRSTFVILGGHTFQLLGLRAGERGARSHMPSSRACTARSAWSDERSVLAVEPARFI